jgi:ribosomal protein S5
MGNSGDGTQKVVKIAGYKSVLQKSIDSETNKENFILQIPMNSTLLTFYADKSSETEILKWANTIPVEKIAKMVQ